MIDLSYLEGVFQIANLFLSIVAIVLAVMLFKRYHTHELHPFKYLMIALILFDIVLIFGALRSFGIYESAYITHFLPGIILGTMMYALYLEIRSRGDAK
jgi:hypothetical protein